MASAAEEVSLRGFTVGITADRRWEEQAALLERRGARVVHGPTIRTLAVGVDEPLRVATERVVARPPAVLIANTSIGIRSWFGAADNWGLGSDLIDALRSSRIYVRGPKASGAIHSAGLEVHAKAGKECLHEAVDLVLADLRRGETVVLQVDGSGDSSEAERLLAAGADVVLVPSYLWKLPEDRRPALRLAEAVIAGRVHAVTFTAAPAVRNWMAIAAEEGLEDQLRVALTAGGVTVGCVGPVCSAAAVAAGLGSAAIVQPDAFRLGPLVRVVTEELLSRVVTCTMASAEVRLSGTSLRSGAGTVDLADSEARLLKALLDRPDFVFAKESLLRTVWPDSCDPHVVEAGIARLRNRLGPLGGAVVSVNRRGYMLRTAAPVS